MYGRDFLSFFCCFVLVLYCFFIFSRSFVLSFIELQWKMSFFINRNLLFEISVEKSKNNLIDLSVNRRFVSWRETRRVIQLDKDWICQKNDKNSSSDDERDTICSEIGQKKWMVASLWFWLFTLSFERCEICCQGWNAAPTLIFFRFLIMKNPTNLLLKVKCVNRITRGIHQVIAQVG